MSLRMNGLLLLSLIGFATAAESSPNDVDVKIQYEQPETEEFRGFGHFDLRVQSSQFDGENLRVRYEVPPDLIGKNYRFMTMRGQLSANGRSMDLFCGETGSTAQCAVTGNRLMCNVQFRNLTPEADRVAEFLKRKYGESDEHMPARLFASKIFGIDAIGTLEIDIFP